MLSSPRDPAYHFGGFYAYNLVHTSTDGNIDNTSLWWHNNIAAGNNIINVSMATVPGETYKVAFDSSLLIASPAGRKGNGSSIIIRYQGGISGTTGSYMTMPLYDIDNDGLTTWVPQTFTFVATDTVTIITFDGNYSDPQSVAHFGVDNFSVANVFAPSVCTYNAPRPFCGDGIINMLNEVCDDGDLLDGNGCSSRCSLESDYICAGDVLPRDGICDTAGQYSAIIYCPDQDRVGGYAQAVMSHIATIDPNNLL
jgi:cysteine-rich repeat protein